MLKPSSPRTASRRPSFWAFETHWNQGASPKFAVSRARRSVLTEWRRTVDRDQSANAVRAPRREAHADRAAEIMHHERDIAQIERGNEAFEIVDVILQPIAAVGRRRALAESHVVRDDDAMRSGERNREMSIQIAPGRFAVQTENEVAAARSLVDVVHEESRGVGEMRREGEAAAETFICSNHLECSSAASSTFRSPRLRR